MLHSQSLLHFGEFKVLEVKELSMTQLLLEQYFAFFHTGMRELEIPNSFFLNLPHRIPLTLGGLKFRAVEDFKMTQQLPRKYFLSGR